MTPKTKDAHDSARIALAAIRLINGVVALFAPATLIRRLGLNPDTNPAALYALRLFGVRTIVIAAELLQEDRAVRAFSLRVGVLIHFSDAMAAAMAGLRKQLPARAAIMATLISTVNTILAIAAQRGQDQTEQ